MGLDLRNPKPGILYSVVEEHGFGLNPDGTLRGLCLLGFLIWTMGPVFTS